MRGGAAARAMCRPPAGPWACCAGCCPCCGRPFPRRVFLVRLDGGFATPEIFDFLDAEPRLDYVVAMARNAVLQRHAEPALLVAQAQSAASGQTAQVYGRHPLSGPHVGPRPPRRDQGRGRPARRPRPARQPALRRDQSAPDAALPSMNGSTAPAATSKIGSRSCSMACRSTARAAVASGPINCACSSPPPPTC